MLSSTDSRYWLKYCYWLTNPIYMKSKVSNFIRFPLDLADLENDKTHGEKLVSCVGITFSFRYNGCFKIWFAGWLLVDSWSLKIDPPLQYNDTIFGWIWIILLLLETYCLPQEEFNIMTYINFHQISKFSKPKCVQIVSNFDSFPLCLSCEAVCSKLHFTESIEENWKFYIFQVSTEHFTNQFLVYFSTFYNFKYCRCTCRSS